MKNARMDTELIDITTLTADPANARRHNARNIEAIKSSLSRFGQQKPVVVNSKGQIVAGHGMVEAARALGWSQVAIVRTKLVGQEAAAFAIADNRVGELSEWDDTILAATLESLGANGNLDDLVPGFDAAEIDELFSRAKMDADIAHFGGVAQASASPAAPGVSPAAAPSVSGDGNSTPGYTPLVPTPNANELTLLITGPREAIEPIRTRINETRQAKGIAGMAEALLVLIGEPK